MSDKALPYDLYFFCIQEGMPEMLSTDEQIKWLKSHARSMRQKVDQTEYIRMRFCDVIPGLCSRSWEEIWEKVRDAFKEQPAPNRVVRDREVLSKIAEKMQGIEEETEKLSDTLPARVLAMCKKRNWSLHWTARGAYLHLESSELIESIRGKGDSTPTEEAGDVLLVLMSITENEGIPWSEVVKSAEQKLSTLEKSPPYKNEEKAEV